MNHSLSRRVVLTTAAAILAFGAAAQSPAHLPTKPVRIVVGYPAGQTVDIVARDYAAALATELGQPVYVDNRPGANGILGASETKKSAADGTTLLLGTLGQMAINPTLYKKIPYDTLKDFAPVALTSIGPLLLVAPPSFPPNNVAELLAYVKANPGKVNYGSGGNGITAHLAMEILQARAGIKLTHIPYKGSPAALNDLMAGQVSLMFDAMPSSLPLVKAGKLKVLGISSLARNTQLPSTATINEQGLKGFEILSWLGFFAPAGTPPETVAALNAAIGRASASTQVQNRIQATGSEPLVETPAYFTSFLQAEVKKWGKAVIDSGVQID